jgi:hypothetical protein
VVLNSQQEVVMTGVWLMVVLAAGDVGAARDEARLHAALGVVVTGGASTWAAGYGPGVNAELGVVLRDRMVLSARVNLGTTVALSAGTLGVGFDSLLGERWAIGLGAALGVLGGWWEDQPHELTAQVPVRVQYSFFTRGDDEVARRSVVVFAEVSPGVSLSGSPGFRYTSIVPDPTTPRFSGVGVLGVSYSWF